MNSSKSHISTQQEAQNSSSSPSKTSYVNLSPTKEGQKAIGGIQMVDISGSTAIGTCAKQKKALELSSLSHRFEGASDVIKHFKAESDRVWVNEIEVDGQKGDALNLATKTVIVDNETLAVDRQPGTIKKVDFHAGMLEAQGCIKMNDNGRCFQAPQGCKILAKGWISRNGNYNITKFEVVPE